MLEISKKAQEMPLSAVRKLVPFSDAAEKRGVKVYHLNIGQPDVFAPKEALNAVKQNTLNLVSYPHSAGNASYRAGLAKYYNSVGIDVTVSDMIVTTGGSEALIFAFMICLNQGDEVIVTEPFYTNYRAFARWADVTLKPVSSGIPMDFTLPPVSAFEKAITPKTKAILLCNPSNPTGYVYTKEELESLGALVKKHNLYLFADEVYRDFLYADKPFYSCMQLKGVEQNVVLIDSASKRYSLCGVRIGAIVSRNKDVMAAALRFAQSRLCSPAYGQIAAEGALNTPPEYFTGVRAEYRRRRDYMIGALNKIEGVHSPMPEGAFYTVTQFPVDDCDKFAQWLLESFEYEKQTVMIAPASGFYVTPGGGRNEARVAYVLKVEDLEKAMAILEIALKQYPGRTV
ncbi:MAG: pyridoxal phosphate-dependent aminotransferase [Prevotellaceae bacterium]|jgi:aspartate aminotransferase|nr:pyridoxal phosphate-dependent aminotransferase [Prevotellaceae bacterium]